MSSVDTVLIQTPPSPENPTGQVVINRHDYDPTKHQLVEPADPTVPLAPSTAGGAESGGKKKSK